MSKGRGAIKLVIAVLVAALAWGIPSALANSGDVQADAASSRIKASTFAIHAEADSELLDSQEAFKRLEGSGTQADPYKLSTPSDYAILHAAVNDEGASCNGLFFQQTCDIELPALSSGAWMPIGCRIDETEPSIQAGANMRAFSGTLDGGGYTITVPEGSKPLFGYVRGATIRNFCIYGKRIEGCGLIDNMEGIGLNDTVAVMVENVTIKSGTSILGSGILSCRPTSSPYSGTSASFASKISGCTVEEGVVIGYDGTQSMVGSIAGRFNGTIENCTSAATVKGRDFVGGIVGSRDQAMGTYEIFDCTFSGTVEAEGECVGGIAGGNYDNSTAPNGGKPTIEGCSVSGNVIGADLVGGILGGDRIGIQAWSDARIANNSVTGQLEANNGFAIGGIVGFYANLNKHDVFQNNCFKDDCGASSAFGEVVTVDTSNAAYAGTATAPFGKDAATGAYYYCSDGAAVDYLNAADAVVTGLLGTPKSPFKAITHQNESRNDDPLSVDAASLAYSNETGELENTCVSLRLSGNYKTDYAIGEAFSTEGMVITGTWTDGTSREVDPEECTVTGFDASKAGYQSVKIAKDYGVAQLPVLVTNGASIVFNPSVSGTVYLSVSDNARYRVSNGAVSGTVMWHVPIRLADVAAWTNSPAYEALGLQRYGDFAPMGAAYRCKLTVMQLFAYANERFSNVGAAGLEFSGKVGSSFMKNGFFGHDDNLNYYVNGNVPTDSSGSLMATSERIELKNGMYVDVAMFSNRTFFTDRLAGYHYFLGSAGKPVHAASAKVGVASQFKLMRIFEFTGGYTSEAGATVYWGTESDWRTWASKGSAPTSNRSGSVKTKANGTVGITFSKSGTYYVWTAGSKGEAGGEHATSIVSTPAALKVTVSKGTNTLSASAKAASKIPAATYGVTKNISAASAFTVSKPQGTLTYKKKSGNEKIKVASNGGISVQKGLKVGTYSLTVAITAAGNGDYNAVTKTATVKIRVLRAANKVTPKKLSVPKTLKVKDLKKKAATIALPKVTTKYGTAKWVVSKKDAKNVLSLKGSKVVVKKGAKKGNYVLKLKAQVAKSANYNAATSKVVTVKVSVK